MTMGAHSDNVTAGTDATEEFGSVAVAEPQDTDSTSSTGTASTGRKLRKPVLAVAAALAVALVAGGSIAAAMNKTVTITVDGQAQEISTFSGSVSGALESAGLSVSEHDMLAPAADTAIQDGSQIAIERGRLLTLSIDGQTREVWTTADTVEEALTELGQNPASYTLSADRSREIPLDGLALSAETIHSATVADGAGAAEGVQSSAETVGALLAERGITLGELDTVAPAAETPLSDGLQIAVTRVAKTTVTEQVDVPQPADQQVEDSSATVGTSTVTQQGTAGKDQVTYEVTSTNGAETSKVETGRSPLTAAQPTIVSVGTKEPVKVSAPAQSSSRSSQSQSASSESSSRSASSAQSSAPAQESASSSSSSSSTPAPSSSGSSGINWDGIAQCESTNNWSINTGNGYYGGLQFDIPTWNSGGGSQYASRPDLASREQQIAVAENVAATRGSSPWACASHG
ncbi:DUF348 domain-containing protein [Nakamurella flava]|uniref:DUF348 domain-containing protein n=2 Tax=Nakamurella flava TaxID=2576308 RepID=A0A4U6QMU8_9ACTN|nr:DUF348 domain-containing protein [Nakamurella flava]